MVLQTERLILRPWRDEDAGALFKYASDPDVGPRAGWRPHESIVESLAVIRNAFRSEGMWAVELKETSEVIGSAGYLPAANANLRIGPNDAEVGYWIAHPYWGRGLGTEALRAVVNYCFGVMGFKTLWGDYFPNNLASGKVMEKCGFVNTGKKVRCPRLEVGARIPVCVMRLDRPAEV